MEENRRRQGGRTWEGRIEAEVMEVEYGVQNMEAVMEW
jgi:hypothetical protein